MYAYQNNTFLFKLIDIVSLARLTNKITELSTKDLLTRNKVREFASRMRIFTLGILIEGIFVIATSIIVALVSKFFLIPDFQIYRAILTSLGILAFTSLTWAIFAFCYHPNELESNINMSGTIAHDKVYFSIITNLLEKFSQSDRGKQHKNSFTKQETNSNLENTASNQGKQENQTKTNINLVIFIQNLFGFDVNNNKNDAQQNERAKEIIQEFVQILKKEKAFKGKKASPYKNFRQLYEFVNQDNQIDRVNLELLEDFYKFMSNSEFLNLEDRNGDSAENNFYKYIDILTQDLGFQAEIVGGSENSLPPTIKYPAKTARYICNGLLSVHVGILAKKLVDILGPKVIKTLDLHPVSLDIIQTSLPYIAAFIVTIIFFMILRNHCANIISELCLEHVTEVFLNRWCDTKNYGLHERELGKLNAVKNNAECEKTIEKNSVATTLTSLSVLFPKNVLHPGEKPNSFMNFVNWIFGQENKTNLVPIVM
jgi:hypothetical protein